MLGSRTGSRVSSEGRVELGMLFFAVVSDLLQEAVELFTSREEAEAVVQAWDRDEP
jgi:hypothetical protein